MNKLKFNKELKEKIDSFDLESIKENIEAAPLSSKLLTTVYLHKLMRSKPGEVFYNKILNDYEIASQKDLSGSQTLAKLGPVLGLMGTLIPMGPALVGLAAGDIETMAMNMQVAFATTVIGLFSGAIGFIIMQVKKRWYAADVSNLEFIAELLKQSNQTELR